MRAQIHPKENFISIDGEPLALTADKMPAGPELEGFVVDASRPIEVIHFDGAIGMIQRRSRAPGRNDVEHFIGPAPLKPYKDAYDVEKARLAEVRAKLNAEEEARAAQAAELAAQADIEKTKKG